MNRNKEVRQMKVLFTMIIALLLSVTISAQYIDGSDVKYGNEWIDFSQEYFKIQLSEDGVYRITKAQLESAGFPVSTVPMSDFAMFRLGEETHIHVSTDGIMGNSDYIEFYGLKNRNELDLYSFEDKSWQLNPEFSLITDISAYFLCYAQGEKLRYQNLTTDLSGNLPPAEDYYMHYEKNIIAADDSLKNAFSKSSQQDVRYSSATITEGFGSSLNTSHDFIVNASNIYNNGPDPSLKIRFGTNRVQHNYSLQVNNTLVKEYAFSNYQVIAETINFPLAALSPVNTIRTKGNASTSDLLTVSEASLIYPRLFSFNGDSIARFDFNASPFSRYFVLDQFDLSGNIPIAYDLSTNRRIQAVIDGSEVKLISPATPVGSKIRVHNSNSLKDVISISKTEFFDYTTLNHDYIILSAEGLFTDPSGGENWVQEYADYRSSSIGGSYNPIIVEVQQLYDQFGYGVNEHYLALRSFFKYIENDWTDLEYLFIVGKAREYGSYRFGFQKDKDPNHFVPTYGFPGSDNLLVANWGETTPRIAVGRLAAESPEDVRVYLNKVIAHEIQINNPQTIEGKLWMKRMLHLSGGDINIQELIAGYLGNMENIISNNSFGADIKTFYKKSTGAVEEIQSEEIVKIIDNGTSMITFFGHSAVGVFDLNLENVEEYNNYGKYPLMISLGCHSGNVHTSAYGLSQQWVLAQDRGAIAFWAASASAYIDVQHELGKTFYQYLGSDLYGKPLGKIVQQTIADKDYLNSTSWETLLEQLTLHGDPAITLHSPIGEDYTPDFSSVRLEPEIINAFQDSFQLCFDVANLGEALPKEMSISIKHTGPQGQINADTSIVRISPKFKENYCLNLLIKTDDLVGKNTIQIFVDDQFAIEESPNPYAENNNSLVNTAGGDEYEFFILNNGAVPVNPKNFSIYNKENVLLMASSFNALGDNQSFIMQLDTTDKFNSSLRIETSIDNATGLLRWDPDFNFEQGRVYYWRVSPEQSSTGSGLVWNGGSFIYLPNSKSGWNQSHIHQYEQNEFDELQLQDGKLAYVTDYREIKVKNKVREPDEDPGFFIKGTYFYFSYLWDLAPGLIAVTPVDELGNFFFNTPEGQYGSLNPWNAPSFTYYFDPQDQESRIALVNFVTDTLDDGDYVFLYTVLGSDYNVKYNTAEWAADSIINNGRNIFNTLEGQGGSVINDFRNREITPYNCIYQKNTGMLRESRAEDIFGTTEDAVAVFGRWYKGTETSQEIGPATKWNTFVWKDELSSVPENDSSYMNIFGVTVDGKDTLLMSKILEKEINLAQIDASVYPYLKVQYYTYDRVNRTSPDLTFWRIFYKGQAELALDPQNPASVFNADTLDQGDQFVLKLPLTNIGAEDVDSINVKITVIDQDNSTIVSYQKLAPIAVDEHQIVSFEIPTQDLSGIFTITVEANFDRNPEECFFFNNFALRKFVVRNDIRNPLLDVSFDGRRIMNGDLVSSEPVITIITKDENKFLLMNDTSAHQISIIDPDGLEEVLSFNDPQLLFTPATDLNNNQSEIMYSPIFEKDGDYSLRVRSSDRSGNLSGSNDFQVDFKIVNEELISNVLNYPNPFSECTQFIFTLTGNEMPEDLSIKIMTVSGKVVREISSAELGPLNIGINRTEFKWDGTDQFGSKLANGVYLYQVRSRKIGGEVYEKYDVGTDQFFKNNIGKLVILR